MALAAAAAGKAIYCEKPMALTLEDAAAMAGAAAAAGVATLVGYNYVRNPAVLHARRLIAEGVIGEIAYFRGVYDEDYMARSPRPSSWRCGWPDAGLGALGDLAAIWSRRPFPVGPGWVAAVPADSTL
jgi:predicted dehydrogenase